MSREQQEREAAKPINRRRVRARLKRWMTGDVGEPGVAVQIAKVQAWITPAAAYALADQLVDHAERAEALEVHGGGQ